MSFERLLKPRSIAVFGGAQAQEVIRQSDRMGYKGEIWPVHPKKTEILGRKVYRSVEDLPESPDAAYVGVNRNLTIDVVRDLAARDAGGAVCYATGFIEAGEEGSELQKQLLEASGNMPLVGPNCYGILNYLDGRCSGPISRAANGSTKAWPSSPCRRTWVSTSPCSGVAFPSLT